MWLLNPQPTCPHSAGPAELLHSQNGLARRCARVVFTASDGAVIFLSRECSAADEWLHFMRRSDGRIRHLASGGCLAPALDLSRNSSMPERTPLGLFPSCDSSYTHTLFKQLDSGLLQVGVQRGRGWEAKVKRGAGMTGERGGILV